MSTSPLRDVDWVRQSFMLPKRTISNSDALRRTLSDARFKFTDTTLGGSFAINPPYQFTRFADIPVPSLFAGSAGLGRYYSEAIEDNAQLIHMRFGVPQFNSLLNYFFNFFNPQAARMARTGRSYDLAFSLGKITGTLFPLPVQLFTAAGAALNFLMGRDTSKYYYLKPTMPLYWNAVNTIANGIAVNMGLVPRIMSNAEKSTVKGEPEYTAEVGRRYQRLNPEVWHESGEIDVYSLASRAQRIANEQRRELNKALETGENAAAVQAKIQAMVDSGRYFDSQREIEKAVANGESVTAARARIEAMVSMGKYTDTKRAFQSYEDYLKSWHSLNDRTEQEDDGSVDVIGKKMTFKEKTLKFFEAEYEDGAQFVTFHVEHTGTVSESFSNSATEPEISSKLNGLSSGARQARFSSADGQTGIGFIDDMLQMGGAFIEGVASAVNLQGLLAFSGSAIADIPKMWDSSSADLPKSDYQIKLRTPYGNDYSRFTDLFIPLSMLLAGSLPISTGKQSYTSPFLCEVYDKGRTQTRLGMIQNLQVSRGEGNLGWTRDMKPLGINVSFSVMDLSSIMHMPITAGFDLSDAVELAGAAGLAARAANATSVGGVIGRAGGALGLAAGTHFAKGFFDSDTIYSDYLATLASLSLTEQVYAMQKLRINMTRQFSSMNTWFSASHFANWVMGSAPARLISAKAVGMSL